MAADFCSEADFAHLAERVMDASLPRAEWTHAAHFALALWVLRHRPDMSDPDKFRTIIIRLNEALGTANTGTSGYHHTITCASLRATEGVLAEIAGEARLPEILADMMAGPFGRSDWIFAYWTRDCLFSVAARRDWVEPDIAPLPW